MITEKEYWQPPPKGFLKYNIDGAYKGNTGTTSYGGALRDDEGNIIFIFHYHLGRATNNMAEVMAPEQCREFLSQSHCSNIIVEADSEITINAVERISGGSRPERVSNHSKLFQGYQKIQLHLQGLRTISFNHVRRNANKLADLLANQGVSSAEGGMVKKWLEIPPSHLKAICNDQAAEDREVFKF